ncbi:mCG1051089 [Mus musculus]|nr:mCG1051089 [Mus musculus]
MSVPTFRVTLGSKDTPGIKIRMLKKLNMICGRIHEVFVSYHSLMTAWISTDDVHLCLLGQYVSSEISLLLFCHYGF